MPLVWKWFDGSAMRGENGLFNDGLTKDGSCANNGQTQWTYNQAALLPGLGFLVKCRYFYLFPFALLCSYHYSAGDAGALDSANAIIDAVIANLVVDGALVESCDSSNTCNVDQQTFKGIAVYFMCVVFCYLYSLFRLTSARLLQIMVPVYHKYGQVYLLHSGAS